MDHFDKLGNSKLANASADRHELQGNILRKEHNDSNRERPM